MKREWLIAFRKAKGLSQEEIAESLKISPSTYSMYEQGTRRPSPEIAKAIARIFKFDWTKFYENK